MHILLLNAVISCSNILTVYCVPLSTIFAIENGNVSYTTPLTEEGYLVTTLAELNCDPGHKPSASSQEPRRCERSGEWSGQTQTCIAGTENKTFKIRHLLYLHACCFLNPQKGNTSSSLNESCPLNAMAW